jgi:hypothetical protein
MLGLPAYGLSLSVTSHNVRVDSFCDWLEGSVLFGEDEELHAPDVVDVLCENLIYRDQGFAWEMVDDAWGEIDRRQQRLGRSSALMVAPRLLRRRRSWRESAALSFCLALSYTRSYPHWAGQFGGDYTEQGRLFEDLCAEAVRHLLPGWDVRVVGWRPDLARSISEVAQNVASLLDERTGDVGYWAGRSARDAGLDILFYRSFGDGRPGVPTYLLQCASGADWRDKLGEPDIALWRKLVAFAADPKKAFATPHALPADEFPRVCARADAVVFDRYRLLSAGSESPAWMSAELGADLIRWLEPRLEQLPKGDD